MRKRSIMILGAGLLQLPAIRTAKEMGCTTLVVDGDPNALGRKEADAFEPVDLKDLSGLLEVASRWKERYGLDGVFTAGTDFSASVAYVAEALGLPGIPYQTALDASRKNRMRKRFTQAGIPSPSFKVVTQETVDSVRSWDRFPAVVKPVDNMGARGVVRVDSPEELRERVRESLPYSRSGKVVVEEFIEGPEFSLDALVYKGSIQICGFADRHIRFPPYFVEVGHTLPSQAPPEVQREVVRVFTQGIQALGIDPGAAKGDIFYSPRGGMVGEIAARLSGGFMSGWTYPYASGVNLTEGALLIALGQEPGDRTPKLDHTSAERALISIPGKVMGIEGVEEAKRVPGVKELFLRTKPGDRVVFPTNNVEKCGNVIAAAPERESAVRAAEEAISRVLVRLDPMDQGTEEFLFTPDWQDGRSYFPMDGSVMRRLQALPWAVGQEGSLPLQKGFPLPVLSMEGCGSEKGWNYLSFTALLEKVAQRAREWRGARWLGQWVPGALFWFAAFRGGEQGVVWVLDRCFRCDTLEELKETAARWAGKVGF